MKIHHHISYNLIKKELKRIKEFKNKNSNY